MANYHITWNESRSAMVRADSAAEALEKAAEDLDLFSKQITAVTECDVCGLLPEEKRS